MLAVAGPNALLRKGLDGVFPQIHEGHVRPVIGLEIAVIEDHALGADKVVRHQLASRFRIFNGLPDLSPDEL